ncbi:hypothetical protein [Legionella sp. km772]|uniref:hypothetical protein n=1 Tax=Legionella sp. km772 TaxID=2498111 RepID=UPI000F8D6D1A|nr:hypothetical protein [Legionella sp. km772]RUR12327.1 hypothetical protein ELY15_05370 [Legionella sp. km772]
MKTLLTLFGLGLVSSAFAVPLCTGTATSACSKITSESTCANYYLSGSSDIQCKWNGSYCSDGGGICATVACKGTAVSSCSSLVGNECNNSYTTSGYQCLSAENGCFQNSSQCASN